MNNVMLLERLFMISDISQFASSMAPSLQAKAFVRLILEPYANHILPASKSDDSGCCSDQYLLQRYHIYTYTPYRLWTDVLE